MGYRRLAGMKKAKGHERWLTTLVIVTVLLGAAAAAAAADSGCGPTHLGLGCNVTWKQCDPCWCCLEGSTHLAVACCGESVTDVPENLPRNATHMKFAETAIVNLTANLVAVTYGRQEEHVPQTKFYVYQHLKALTFADNALLTSLEVGSLDFWHKGSLDLLVIDGSPRLTAIQPGALGGFKKLQHLKIVHCGLTMPPAWGVFAPGDKALDMDLSNNKIQIVKRNSFTWVSKVEIGKLILSNNLIETIEDFAFNGSTIGDIRIGQNPKLRDIHSKAFAGIKSLTRLDLSATIIDMLPTEGLEGVEHLILQETKSLKTFPSVLQLASIETVQLTYAHHCCAFAHPDKQDEVLYLQVKEQIEKECSTSGYTDLLVKTTTSRPVVMDPGDVVRHMRTRRHGSRTLRKEHENTDGFTARRDAGQSWSMPLDDSLGRARRHRKTNGDSTWDGGRVFDDNPMPDSGGMWHTNTLNPNSTHIQVVHCGRGLVARLQNASCTPKPNAFNPCEGVMGHTWLRVGVWFVVTLALVGNAMVLAVTIGSKHKWTVTRLLMCNLAFSDFLLGFYLFLLAAFDLSTIGVYFTVAIPWQYDGGCQVAGFLAILSTCLSTFTLTAITMERWYVISHAIRLDKRISLRQAASIMLIGWILAVVLATLPLVGVSNYSITSICLPMETSQSQDMAYVILLLALNGVAFILIFVGYLDMYRQIRSNNSPAGRNDDTKFAKKMFVLVCTDFICLFPLAFFGLTAVFGHPFITVSHAKILLVFFFPFNSCCNPFLYAILTKQFKMDLFTMLSRCGMCERRAAKYRMSSNPISMSQSRNSIGGTISHLVHRPSAGSVLTNLASDIINKDCSRTPRNGSPHHTPQASADDSPPNEGQPMDAETLPNGSAGESEPPPDLGRKLSVVPELSFDDSHADELKNETPIPKFTISNPLTIPDEPPIKAIRSVSEYGENPFRTLGNWISSNFDYEFLPGRKQSETTNITYLSNTTEESSFIETPVGERENPFQDNNTKTNTINGASSCHEQKEARSDDDSLKKNATKLCIPSRSTMRGDSGFGEDPEKDLFPEDESDLHHPVFDASVTSEHSVQDHLHSGTAANTETPREGNYSPICDDPRQRSSQPLSSSRRQPNPASGYPNTYYVPVKTIDVHDNPIIGH